MRIVFLIIFVFNFWSASLLHSQNEINQKTLSINNIWLREALDLTKNCVGFTPPVAARAFAYYSVGMYECGVSTQTEYISLSSQLNNFTRSVKDNSENAIYLPHLFNYFAHGIIKTLYANMPPLNSKNIELLKDSLFLTYSKNIPKATLIATEKYANKLMTDLKKWMALDGADEAYNKNFPATFSPPKCDSCWVSTFPGYVRSLQPYWGNVRFMMKSNEQIIGKTPPPLFSTDTNSSYYKEALYLFTDYKQKDKQKEMIAEYWDDSPGYSGTPTGHLYSIALALVTEHNIKLMDALQLYVLMGISVNDAFIVCWKEKFNYNILRPITYIHRYISPHFNTIIPSPPFPEYPSGHSFQSAAAGEILKVFFTDSMAFTDYTNKNRSDIVGTPRSFKNFSAMVDEISRSRFYGGIHYMKTLDISVEYGKQIAYNTIKNIQFIK